jgi:two-component system phosphate regulon sensor histidine kinase PhoR
MRVWEREITAVILLLLISVIVGGITGHIIPMIFLVMLGIIVVQFAQITRFEKWIRAGGRGKYPKTKGIWEDIYYHVYRIKKSEKRRKKKLRNIIDQFRQSTEALPNAVVILGPHDEIDWANKAAREVFGLKTSDKGQRIPNLIRFPEFIRYLRARNYKESVVVPSPVDNRISLEVKVISYGAGLRLLMAQDITQFKKMELMRKDFVANVSHELRTPLTVLKGYIETLQDMDDEHSPLLTNSFIQMQGQTERMQHLVDDLLLLARLETQQKKTTCVNVPSLLTQICNESDTLGKLKNRIQLTLESSANIVGEEQELRSAFTNLVSNALKYSKEDSTVKVRWYEDTYFVVLTVEDNGEGIAKADIPRITERFYRVETKRQRKVNGTGLGLAIVKHVLMRHDAHLNISSELFVGSCFSCHFPIKRICN